MSVQEEYDDYEGFDPDDDTVWCVTCDSPLQDNPAYGRDGDECRACGLKGCWDDLCHGQGWCMHS